MQDHQSEDVFSALNPATLWRDDLELNVLRASDQAFRADPEAADIFVREFTGGYEAFFPQAFSMTQLREILSTFLMMLPEHLGRDVITRMTEYNDQLVQELAQTYENSPTAAAAS